MNRAALAIALLTAGVVAAEDWPRWRGPRGDGTFNAPQLPAEWPAGGPKSVWRQPVGGGYAGISVANGRVYTLDLEKPITPTKDDAPDGTERVLCFDTATGKPIWSHKYPVRYGDLGGYANGPRCTPTVHDGKVYTLGAVGHLLCLDAATGKVIWERDTVKECGARVPMWGFAASPVIDGERVLAHVGARPNGSVIALDLRTGKEVWRSLPDDAGYSTPVLIEPKSGRQLVVWTPENINGLEPETGKRLWSVPHKENYGVSIATPIFRDGILFVTGYWEGAKAIRLGEKPTDAELVWQDRRQFRGLMAQPLYRDGHVYTIDKGYGLTCFELKTGKKIWDDDNRLTPRGRNPHASIVSLGDTDRVLALNAVGELVLARLTPEGYDEQSRTKVLNGRVWGHPAFSGRHMFAKTDGAEAWQNAGPHELVCVDLTTAK
ncbi:MAG TPA: PQQ-binding-like beta-propeller repeat protein [Gemmataceae bacterium]|nr:PQQ-binding-like beta-propeller repeat protein [Gemmataceae bacterium]